MKPTHEQIISAYRETNNVHKAGAIIGISAQTVLNHLKKDCIARNNPKFTDDEKDTLQCEYQIYKSVGKLDDLARKMGHTKQFICRQAKKLGLTDKKKREARSYAWTWKHKTREEAEKMLDDFKKSSLGSERYCKTKGFNSSSFSETMRKFFPAEWECLVELKAPKQSMYRLGRSFEYSTRDDLRKKGYFVLRSPASKSPLDLIAIKPQIILFVQCKINGDLPRKEWNPLFDLAQSVDAIPILATRIGFRGRKYEKLDQEKDGSRRKQPKSDFIP